MLEILGYVSMVVFGVISLFVLFMTPFGILLGPIFSLMIFQWLDLIPVGMSFIEACGMATVVLVVGLIPSAIQVYLFEKYL